MAKTLYGWDDRVTCAVASWNLDDRALMFFNTQEVSTWYELKEMLLVRFGVDQKQVLDVLNK